MTVPNTGGYPFFHNFTKPIDFCRTTTATRTNFVFDGDTIGGAVRIYLGYKYGPMLERWQRPDGLDLSNKVLDISPPPFAAERGSWQGQPAYWAISNSQAYTTTFYPGPPAYGSSFISVHTDSLDVDMSCPVKVTTGNAGLIVRAGANVGNIYYIDSASARVKFATNPGTGTTGTVLFTGSTVITLGVFHTLRVVVVGDLYTFYVDGNLEGSTSTSVNNNPPTYPHGLWSTDVTARFAAPFQIAKAANPVATAYEVRNYDGDIVASGPVTDDHVDIADSLLRWRGRGPYGWYRFYLFGPDHLDNQWQTAYGDCSFLRVRTDSNFATNPGLNIATVGLGGVDEIAHSVLAPTTERYQISSSTSGTPAANNAGVIASATYAAANWTTRAYSTRPRTLIGEFAANTVGVESSVITPTVALMKDIIKGWEGRNEPIYNTGEDYITNEFGAFRTAVKAGDPTAKVIGPGTVQFNGTSGGTPVAYLAFIDSFLAACATRGPTYLDGLSIHAYNAFNGDLNMTRRSLSDLKTVCANRGYTGPIYQTEQGFQWMSLAWENPRHACRWTMSMWFLCELYGLPIENNFYWYELDQGNLAFPMWWLDVGQGPGPQMHPIRVMAAEIADRTLANQIDFGTIGNQLYAGGIWSRADGSKTMGLMADSVGATNLTLSVSGTSSLTCSDPWGNTFALTVTNGFATFPIGELPQWVRIPSGVTVAVTMPTFGTNYAGTATPSATQSQTNLNKLNDGVIGNQYYSSDASYVPYQDISNVLPQTITLDFGVPVTANRIIIHTFPPWQSSGTPLDFDIDTFDGATWTTRLHHPTPALKTYLFTSTGRCIYESFWDEQFVWDVSFTTAPITKARLVIRQMSYGDTDHPTLKYDIYGPDPWPYQEVRIQDIQVFNATSTTTLAPRIRNPAAGGVTS